MKSDPREWYQEDEMLDELEELEELEESEPLDSMPIDVEALCDSSNWDSNTLPENWSKSLKPFQPMFLLDQKLRLKWTNQALVELYSPRELQGIHRLSQLFQLPEGHETYQDILLSLRKPERNYNWSGSVTVILPQWGVCHLVCILLPMGNEHPTGFLGIIENHTKDQRDLIFKTFQSLLEASLLKDNDTGNHIKRVNAYSHFLSEKVKDGGHFPLVDNIFVEDISYLASMHDVGKIGTPDDILNKAGSLEEWEMRIMREHTTNGAFIMSNYPNPMAKDIALNHHERWNGEGYPFGKQGEMIPLSARIVAVADVYDALRAERSYKRAWTHEKAKKTIEDSSGEHFDPYLVKLFSEYHDEFHFIWDKLQD